MGWNNVARALRVDLRSVDDSIAIALLREYGGWPRREAARWIATLNASGSQPLFPLDYDDLVSVGETAIFEAWTTYRDGDVSREPASTGFGGGFSAHVRRVVSWRIADYVGGTSYGQPPAASRCDAHNGAMRDVAAPELGADEKLYNQELRVWLRQGLAALPLQQRAIVVGISKGESQAALARTLGLDRRDVHREYHRGLDRLRKYVGRLKLQGVELG